MHSLRPPSELGFSALTSRAPAESSASASPALASLTSPELVETFRSTVLALFDRASLDAPHFLPLAEALEAQQNEVISRWRKTTSLTMSSLHTMEEEVATTRKLAKGLAAGLERVQAENATLRAACARLEQQLQRVSEAVGSGSSGGSSSGGGSGGGSGGSAGAAPLASPPSSSARSALSDAARLEHSLLHYDYAQAHHSRAAAAAAEAAAASAAAARAAAAEADRAAAAEAVEAEAAAARASAAAEAETAAAAAAAAAAAVATPPHHHHPHNPHLPAAASAAAAGAAALAAANAAGTPPAAPPPQSPLQLVFPSQMLSAVAHLNPVTLQFNFPPAQHRAVTLEQLRSALSLAAEGRQCLGIALAGGRAFADLAQTLEAAHVPADARLDCYFERLQSSGGSEAGQAGSRAGRDYLSAGAGSGSPTQAAAARRQASPTQAQAPAHRQTSPKGAAAAPIRLQVPARR